MNSLEKLRRELENAADDPDFVYERLLLDVNERIVSVMERAGVKKADLAERLGTSRAYVSRLLGGPENVTLRTLVRVAMALESRVEVNVRPAIENSVRVEQAPADWNIVPFPTGRALLAQERMYA